MLELLDAGVDAGTKRSIAAVVEALVDGRDLLGVRNVRGVKSGGKWLVRRLSLNSVCSVHAITSSCLGQTHLDLTISVPAGMTVSSSHAVELRVREAIIRARRDIREVKIHVHGVEEGEDVRSRAVHGGGGGVDTDFGKGGC